MTEALLSRRGLFKGAAVVGAALGTVPATQLLEDAGKAYAESPSQRKVKHTACHGCGNCCPVRVYTEDGVVVKIEGDPDGPINKGGACLKCLSQLQIMYSPRRVLHPMKRAGERGENKWEAISWDEAIDIAGTQISTAVEKYGGLAYWSARGGGGAYVEWETRGLDNTFGGANSLASGACQCAMPRFMVTEACVGFNACSSAEVVDHFVGACSPQELDGHHIDQTERVFVLWGIQPSASGAAHCGRGLADSRADLGCKSIVIDPYLTPDAAKADVWLPVRPGSDTALLLCWIRYIIDNKLYHETFTKYWTNLPFLINPETRLPYHAEDVWPDYVNPAADPNGVYDTPAYVCFDAKTNSVQPFPYTAPENSPVDPVPFTTAEVNGVQAKTAGQIYWEEAEPWTLEATAENCWLDADRIEEAIKLYAGADYAGITGGVFSDHLESSSTIPLGMLALDALMGYILTPCSGYQNHGAKSLTKDRPTFRHAEFSGNFKRYGLGWEYGLTKEENDRVLAGIVADWDAKGRDGAQMQREFFQASCDKLGSNEHKGAHEWATCAPYHLKNAMITGEPYRPRVMYEMSGNKYAVMGPAKEWKQAYDQQDFIIQQYPIMTSFTVASVDLFLPTVEWLEYDNYEPTTTLNNTYARHRITHIGETAHPLVVPYQVAQNAAKKLGDKCFDPDAYKEDFFESTDAACAVWAKKMGFDSWDEFVKSSDKPYTDYPIENYFLYRQNEGIVSDGLPRGFATLSRKVDVYSEVMIRLARTGFPYMYPMEQPACEDYDPICTFKEPTWSPLTDTEYPLVLTNGRMPHFHHGTMRHAPFIRELMPEPELKINPETAEKYGIEHMDWVKVTSRKGSMRARAYLTQGIAPGVLITERFWNPECFDESQKSITPGFEECGVNCITTDEFRNPCFASNSYRAITVKIEKSTRPDRVWVESEQFEPFMPTLQGEEITKEVF